MSDLVADILARCDDLPEQVALRSGRHSLTYAELGARIRRTAHGLRQAGLKPGDRVFYSIRPSIDGFVLALGIVAAGGSLVLIDPGSTPELFVSRLGAAHPRWAATESLLYTLSHPRVAWLARRKGILLPDYAALDVRHLYSGKWLPGVPRRARRVAALDCLGSMDVYPDSDAEALIVFTSGTTARPRGVVHTRGSLGAAATLFQQVCELGPTDVVFGDQISFGAAALVAGATWSLATRPISQRLGQYAEGLAGATLGFLVPADVTALLDAIERGEVPAVGPATMLVGGAPVTAALLSRAVRLLPETRWVSVYGMTEMLPVAAVDASEKIAYAEEGGVGDLIGRPLDGVAVGFEGVGELVVSGPSLMRGYVLDESPATEHHTGDLASLDEAGRLRLLGRTRDMIIRGTTNLYPGLFEPAITRLPGVHDALLIGVPRPGDADEVVVLVVCEGEGGSDDLVHDPVAEKRILAQLRGVVDSAARPDHVLIAGQIPLSGRSRKPDRVALRAAAAHALGLL